MEKIKRCPFCGETHQRVDLEYGHGVIKDGVDIACLIGNHDGEVHLDLNKFNTRPIENDQSELIDKMGYALFTCLLAERRQNIEEEAFIEQDWLTMYAEIERLKKLCSNKLSKKELSDLKNAAFEERLDKSNTDA
jgi:hypothetical protein